MGVMWWWYQSEHVCGCMFLALLMGLALSLRECGASLRKEEVKDQMTAMLFRQKCAQTGCSLTCIKMLLLLFLGCSVSCCLRNRAAEAGNRSEWRAGQTRSRVLPFSSSWADEGSELCAAASYSSRSYLAEKWQRWFFWGDSVLVCFTTGRRKRVWGFFPTA